MKYEEVIAKAQSYTPELPEMPAAQVPKAPWNRRNIGVAVGLGVVIYGYFGVWLDSLMRDSVVDVEARFGLLVPLLVAGYCFRLLRRQTFRSQLLLRALLWSNVVIGVLLASFVSMPAAGPAGTFVAVGAGVALLLLMRQPLESLDDPVFRPVAFFGRLSAALAMAAADAHTLVFSAFNRAVDALDLISPLLHGTSWGVAWLAVQEIGPVCLAAAAMVLVVWGLVRLKTWALFANIAVNFVVAALALNGVLGLSIPVAASLAITAVLQLLLPVPLLATVLGQDLPANERRHMGLVRGSVVVLATASLVGLVPIRPFADHAWSEHRALWRGQAPDITTTKRGAPHLTHGRAKTEQREPDLLGKKVIGAGLECDVSGRDWSERRWVDGEHGMQIFASLSRCDAMGLDAHDGVWRVVALFRVNMTGARLDGLDGQRMHWLEVDFTDGNARGADLRLSIMNRSTFRDSDFSKADLRGADFRHSTFERVSFRGADLRDARLPRANLTDVDWTDATCPDGTAAADHGQRCEGDALERPETRLRGLYTGTFEEDGELTNIWVFGPTGDWMERIVRDRVGYQLDDGVLGFSGASAQRALAFPWLRDSGGKVYTRRLTPYGDGWGLEGRGEVYIEVDERGGTGTLNGVEFSLRRRSSLGFLFTLPPDWF